MKQTTWKRNVTLFLAGQAITLFGSMLVQYAIMWHITLATRSGAAMTLYVIVGILPTFIISPFGGAWADRHDRKKLINLADGGIALVTLAVAAFYMLGRESTWILFACAAARALGQGIQVPAVSAFIPDITPPGHLVKVNGINTSIQSFIQLVSPAASGALLTFMPFQTVFLVDVITAAAGITILYFFVKTPARQTAVAPPPSAKNYFHDLREGFRYIRTRKFIKRLLLITTVLHVMISPAAFLTPLQVARDFGTGVWRLTAIEIAFSAGMMLGGIAIGLRGDFRDKLRVMAWACVLNGTGIILLGVLDNFWWYLAAMFFLGTCIPLYFTPGTTIFQTSVAPEYTGRFFGIFVMIATLVTPAGMLIFGPLGDAVNIDFLLLGSGAIIALLALPLWRSKIPRETGKSDSAASRTDAP
ncbi:MAG: MFS transporter [Odoribacteraceae bacterium]|jgi:DHA3 family macrolide efflux protein-like MFS transporter|nr:MFS transporter [Odoribacteraceae bacterium]